LGYFSQKVNKTKGVLIDYVLDLLVVLLALLIGPESPTNSSQGNHSTNSVSPNRNSNHFSAFKNQFLERILRTQETTGFRPNIMVVSADEWIFQ
jgi:hypothetical protein